MDLVSSYKEKLHSFRIKELKYVLTRLGLPKLGKKQDLVDRIMTSLSIKASELQDPADNNVAGIIDDAYRNFQSAEATSSSINEESFSEMDILKPKEEVADHLYSEKKIRCPCGSALPTEPMIECADKKCGVLQHMPCVIIPEELSEGIPSVSVRHYCEICRLKRSDPFRATVTHLLSPVKLMASNIPYDGSNPMQNVERTFQLTRKDRDLLQHDEYNIQAWCLLLNDKVQFRMQWPLFADLKVNGVPVRTVNRPGSQLLGANGRDDGPMIAFYMVDGLNRISLSGCDARSFCLGVRIVKEYTVQQILELILEERNNEPFEDALVRVQRCIGGLAMATEDSDSDLEVISDFVTVNLRCPMGGLRIKTAGRFRPCVHMGCFDLETFVQLNQRSRKWQCPICLKNYSLEDVTVDPYFNSITKMLQDCDEEATEIHVRYDGSWCLKNGHRFKNFDQWRRPDGSLCDDLTTTGTVSNSAVSRELEEKPLVGQINDAWVNKLSDFQTSSRSPQGEHFESYSEEGIVTMSSSSFESHGDGDHHSVKQNGIGNFDIPACSYYEINDPKPVFGNTTVSVSNLDIIVLSDSDEETASLMCPESVSKPQAVNDGHYSVSAPGISNLYTESLARDTGISPSLDILNCNDTNFVMSQQTFSSGTRADSGVQPFHTDKVDDALVDPEYTPVSFSLPTSNCIADCSKQVVTQKNGSLVSPQACNFNAPQTSLQNLSRGLVMQSDMAHLNVSNGIHAENSTPFGHGSNSGGGSKAPGIPSTSAEQNFGYQNESNDALLDPLSYKKVGSDLTVLGKRPNGPFSFPRRTRSARLPHLPQT